MSAFKSYSQAGQDRFVYAVLSSPEHLGNGTFLDIGASHPITTNNTYGLEQIGWSGLCVDKREDFYALRSQRKCTYLCSDALTLDWSQTLNDNELSDSPIDYLSIDIDRRSFDVLKIILRTKYRFRVITIEHDLYAQGSKARNEMRITLLNNKYTLICADVCGYKDSKCPFEDWWVSPDLVRMDLAHRWITFNEYWADIVKRCVR